MGETLAPERNVGLRRYVPPLSAAIPILIFAVAALALPLATAAALALTANQLGGWIVVLFGIPAILSMALTGVYRQPLLVAWHTQAVVFLATLAGQLGYAEMLGAMLVSGGVVALLGATGLTSRLATLIPGPVVFAVVAGATMPFVVGIFNTLGTERVLIGGTLLAYLLGRRFLGARVPGVLPALLVGLALVAVTGRLGHVPTGWSLPAPGLAHPAFSLRAIATIVPVVVPLIALQSNLVWVAYLRGQGYCPPARVIDVATGLGTMLAAFVGPAPICMGSALVPLAAGPEAGERDVRHWSVYATAAGFALVALGASIAAGLPSVLPLTLLLAVAGLALVGALGQAIGELARGPLRLGPLFAFAIASSKLTLLGLGPLFWALVGGTVIAYLLEREEMRAVRIVST